MRRTWSGFVIALALGVLLVGAQDAGGSASIEAGQHEQFGNYLTDSEGRSLYLFTNDERGEASTCYEQCAQNWPPFVVEQAPAAGERVAGSLIGTIEREDGSLQATYYGWPLYYFARDEQPGDVNGHGVGGVWFLVSTYGQAIAAPRQEGAQGEGEAEPAGGAEGEAEAEGEAAGAPGHPGVNTNEGGREEPAGEGEDEGAGEAEPEGEGEAEQAAEEPAAEGTEQGEDGGETAQVSEEVMAEGGNIYRQYCASCHGQEGGGGAGPRLVDNSTMSNPERVARQIIRGGGFMPPFGDQLNDEQVAAVGTFIRNSWGNDYGPVTVEHAQSQRR